MAATEFVIMPTTDYKSICDKVREKTGGEELLKSGDIPPALDNISAAKTLYMEAALLNAGGAYPADSDDYTTVIIPPDATFVSLDAFENLPNVDTVIIDGNAEIETYIKYDSSTKSNSYYNPFTSKALPIKSITIINRTAEIPQYFMHRGLTNFVLELDCEDVGDCAFDGCNAMRSVSFEKVTTIGIASFRNCANIKSVVFPDGLISIASNAFLNCTTLSEVVFPDGLTSIGNSAFQNCNLSEVTIPDGVTAIADFAFHGNRNLTSVTIHEGVTSIGINAFYDAPLQKVTIPISVESIGDVAFSSDTIIRGYSGSYAELWAYAKGYEFESIDGGSSSFEDKILYMDAALLDAGGEYPVDDYYTTAVIPAEATFVSLDAFKNLSFMNTLIINGDCRFEEYVQYEGKDEYHYYATTRDINSIRKLVINDRTSIPNYFMWNSSKLTEAEVSGSIGISAFSGCTNLANLTLKDCQSIGDYAFSGCESLTEITIPASVTAIGYAAFDCCYGLQTITILGANAQISSTTSIPSNVTIRGYTGSDAELFAADNGYTFESIGEVQQKVLYMDADLLNAGGAYIADANDYTAAVIPAEATFVSVEAFANLPMLNTLTVNGNCEFEIIEEQIDEWNVRNRSAITKYSVPIRKLVIQNRTEPISDWFMSYSSSLREAYISGSVGSNSFDGCNNLKKVVLENCQIIGWFAFNYCPKLVDVTLSDDLTEIQTGAFSSCGDLEEISIPSGVTCIASQAFEYTDLIEVTIPASVTDIGWYAFRDCYNLRSVTILGTDTEIPDSGFIPSSTTIYCYAGSTAETFAIENGFNYEVIQ